MKEEKKKKENKTMTEYVSAIKTANDAIVELFKIFMKDIEELNKKKGGG